jgi:hypothetical protein
MYEKSDIPTSIYYENSQSVTKSAFQNELVKELRKFQQIEEQAIVRKAS